ncbi:MAG: DUF3305 domain-containing protein [Rhodospirillaceae bacterium]|jgi:hypothetical protein|nr:DUF3305 domain-containing protein [Rhodospirillaceae bacterium]MBT6218467.1 DUF3305 domain-containing protein [Rhodospirillaceae bacterium]MBT6362235.1 DUF3305 domain-containing protein [Rhodospirillaceae bacterium]
MSTSEKMRVGIVVERREIDNRWVDYTWQPVAVIPGAPPLAKEHVWLTLREGEGWCHYMVGTMDIELFRGETGGYKANLSNTQPFVYVVLTRGTEAGEPEVMPFLVTMCPYEAESYTEGDEEIVDGVPMPDEIGAWLQKFVDSHHVDEPFKKRKNKAYDPRKGGFSRRPPIAGGNGRDPQNG